MPVAGHAQRAAPAVGDRRIPESSAVEHREQLAQRAAQVVEHPLDPVVLGPDRAAPVVAGAAPAEREPVVGGALAVDHEMAEVGEGLAVGDADLVPEGVGQRLGGDHERVQRQHAPVGRAQRRAVALGRDTRRSQVTVPWAVSTRPGR